MLNLVKKQYMTPLIGAIKVTYTHVAVYFNLGTFLFSTAIFWYTTGWKWSLRYLDFNLTYPGFMACLATGAIIFAILVYKFELPSTLRFQFDQMYQHSTLLPADVAEIKQMLVEIKEDRRINRGKRIIRRKHKASGNLCS